MTTGKTYFFTAAILNWKPIFYDEKLKNIILDSLSFLNFQKAVKVYGFVIMPNHIHLILKILDNPNFTNIQLSFMRFTAQKIKFILLDSPFYVYKDFMVNKKDRLFQIWQRNPLAIELYTPKVLEQKLEYIHNNPVQGKWMLADSPLDYPWSSARFYEFYSRDYEFLSHYKEDM